MMATRHTAPFFAVVAVVFGLVCSAATQGTQGRGCANNGDCNDGYDCTVNVCLNLRCSTLVMDPTPTGCCNTIADCFPPQAPCTSVVCDPTLGNQCVYSGDDGCDPGFSSASNPFLSSFPVYVPAATPGVEPSEGEEPEEPAYSPFPSFSTVFLPSAPPSLQIPTVSTLTPLTTFVTLDTPPDPLLQPIPDFTTIKLPSAPPSLQLATISDPDSLEPVASSDFPDRGSFYLPPLPLLSGPLPPVGSGIGNGDFYLPPLPLVPGPAFQDDDVAHRTAQPSLLLLMSLPLLLLVMALPL